MLHIKVKKSVNTTKEKKREESIKLDIRCLSSASIKWGKKKIEKRHKNE